MIRTNRNINLPVFKRIMLILLIITILMVLFIPVNRTIHVTYTCHVLDQQDDSYLGTADVTLAGVYSDYLILRDSFQGHILCPQYEIMEENADPVLIRIGRLTHQNLMNFVNHGSRIDVSYPGTFYAEEDLNTFFIWLMVPSEKDPSASHGRYFLCYPEMTFEDIFAILDRG